MLLLETCLRRLLKHHFSFFQLHSKKVNLLYLLAVTSQYAYTSIDLLLRPLQNAINIKHVYSTGLS